MNRSRFLSHLLRGGLAAGALAVTAIPAFAQSGGQGAQGTQGAQGAQGNKPQKGEKGAKVLAKRRGAMGTVASVNAGAKSFVLTTKQGDLTVTTDSSTVFKAHDVENASFATLAKDQRVVVTGERPNETTLLAKRVMVLKAKEKKEPKERGEDARRTVTTGVVSELAADGTTFKVTPAGGTAVAFKVTAETQKTLVGTATFANGVTARVVSAKDASGNNVALRIRVPA
jgi:hypothetical protein